MLMQCLPGILIPFAGTTLGSACVFFMKKTLHEGVQRALTGFAAGVTLADGQTLAPAEVKPAGADPCVVRVTLHQGVYHQIKRMFGVFDAGVNALHREVIGPVALDAALVPGQWRELTAEEVNALRAAAKPKN